MEALRVRGHRIALERHGAGLLTVYMHCALARRQSLRPLARALGGAAVLIDMPGHGESDDWDGVAPYQALTSEAIAAAVEGDGPAHILGHSFGATAALRLAVERPERVARLTLIEPVYFAAARGTPAHEAHRAAFAPFVAAMEAGHRAEAAAIFNDLWGAQRWSDLPEAMRADLARRIHLITAGGTAIEEDPEGLIAPERLKAVRCPVLFIEGGASPPVVSAISRALARDLFRATIRQVPGAGHMVPLTHPGEVAALIRAEGRETA